MTAPKMLFRVFLAAIVAGLCLAVSRPAAGGEAASAGEWAKPLVERLAADGFDRSGLERLYRDPRAEFFADSVEINVARRDEPAHFDHILDDFSTRVARKFMKKYRTLLGKAGKRYGVPAELVTAVLLMESGCGRCRPRFRIFNVLSSIALADRPQYIAMNRERLAGEMAPEEVERRAAAKAKWAFGELENLLRLARREKLDPLAIMGSWSGAFGYCQFLPSSYLEYGVDGNGDGKVRLYSWPDAVFSTASYLKEHGWRKGLSREELKKVVWSYNHSENYAEAVVSSMEKLSGKTAQNP